MDRLNSLKLNKYDGYGRRFDVPGAYRYRVSILGAGLNDAPAGAEFELTVKADQGKKGQQHNVEVSYGEQSRHYRVKPEKLVVGAGDMVVWYKRDAAGVDYAIVGAGEKDRFDSRLLGRHTFYSHMFRQVGVYHFSNTYGKGGQQSGTVRVVHSGKDREAWNERLKKPPLVTYAGGKFSPREVQVVELGTVIWSVEDEEGISVVAEPKRRVGKVSQVTMRPRQLGGARALTTRALTIGIKSSPQRR